MRDGVGPAFGVWLLPVLKWGNINGRRKEFPRMIKFKDYKSFHCNVTAKCGNAVRDDLLTVLKRDS